MLTVNHISAFYDNYIWAIHDDVDCYVVDPGDHKAVQRYVEERSLNLAGIFVTHHHVDHTGGIKFLTTNKSIPVYGPNSDKIAGVTHRLEDGDRIIVLGFPFLILSTPGHTLDHIAYFTDKACEQPALFCGDTLFSGGCGRLFEGTSVQMQQSLDKISALPENTLIFCAHEYTLANLSFASTIEPYNTDLQQRIKDVEYLRQKNKPSVPSSLELEKKTNPFLRTRNITVIERVKRGNPEIDGSPASVFAALRSKKDNF